MTTLTREQIMQLDDEGLRREIAKAKGWNVWLRGRGLNIAAPPDECYGTFTVVGGFDEKEDLIWSAHGSHWVDDIGDAWKLVEEMISHAAVVNVQTEYHSDRNYSHCYYRRYPTSEDHLIDAHGETAPLAICRCWLLCQEVKE